MGDLAERHGGRCRSCRAPILWAATADGASMPVDPRPATNGNVMLTEQRGRLVAGVLSRKDAARKRATRAVPLHVSHFATCPSADAHRRN